MLLDSFIFLIPFHKFTNDFSTFLNTRHSDFSELSDYHSLTLDRLRSLGFVAATDDVCGVWRPHTAVVKELFKS